MVFEFEVRLFGQLSSELRGKAINLEGTPIDHTDIDPLDLVCVKISNNPGVEPIVISTDGEFHRLVDFIAERSDFDLQAYSGRLQQRFS